MSVATEIQRLQQAKADIKSAIEEKGVTVGDGTIDTYAEKIGEISGGGSGLPTDIAEIQTGSFTVANDTAEGVFVALTMSEAPTNIIVFAENDVQETYSQLLNIYGGICGYVEGNVNQICSYHATHPTIFGIGYRDTYNGGIIDIAKDGFTVRGFTAGKYYFRSATPYHWVAWR